MYPLPAFFARLWRRADSRVGCYASADTPRKASEHPTPSAISFPAIAADASSRTLGYRRMGRHTQPVGFGKPPHLQMSFMGPFLKVP